jgi:hypothetical protein
MSRDSDIEQRLRDGLRARANTFVLAHPDDPPAHIIDLPRHRHPRRGAVAGVAAVVLALGGFLLSNIGVRAPSHHSLATGAPAVRSPSSSAIGAPRPSGVGSAHGLAPGPVPPCPTDVAVPTMASGRYCGPVPPAGNGLGPDGVCTGEETTVPCGPGVTIGQNYAYTVPGGCDGLIIFDGQRWVSELPPPTAVTDFYVWMSLSANGTLRFISPTGAVSFTPYTGQPLKQCSTSTTTTPGTP